MRNLLIIVIFILGCKSKSEVKQPAVVEKVFQYSVSVASDWDQVFVRNTGWFGGDGIFCLSLDGREIYSSDAEILIWFSDSMFGDIINGKLSSGFSMINNSVAILKGVRPGFSAFDFYSGRQIINKPKALFIPNTPDTKKGEYYWLGDGFSNQAKNNDIYLFGYRIKNTGKEAFGFMETGNNLIVIPSGSNPPFENQRQLDIPFFRGLKVDEAANFGVGVLVNTKAAGVNNGDGYIYIYGIRGQNKEVIVARVFPEEIEDFNKWVFWDGEKFSSDPFSLKPIASDASNELSVSSLSDGRYILVSQKGLNGKIYFQIGDSPVGPFKEAIDIYDPAPLYQSNPNLFTYNAKAHPVLSPEGELIISYNVNSFKFLDDIKAEPHLYRPRFIRLKYQIY
ncbi:MAG: DUF4185 domain-containing protein [Sphingobacteriales bacterium]|jgi:hypothetical protein|nr:DUF4185 domain-containing protein [Sphingobacteriales bacterium]